MKQAMEFNCNEEIRDGYLIPVEMKKVWKVQLEMVSKVLEVCGRHHLRIWADGGTLLGCVRHKGYIPWDDDIDLIMPRSDFNKLQEIGPKEITDPYFFQSAYTEKLPFTHPHIQIRKNGTAAILNGGQVLQRCHLGIFIDIFTLDELPDNDKEFDKFAHEVDRQYCKLYYWRKVPFLHPHRFNLKVIGYKLTHSFIEEYRKFDHILERYKGTDAEYVSNLCFFRSGINAKKRILLKSFYSETIMMPFENIELPVPKEFDKILTSCYGDYMTPVQAPSYHGGFAVLDADHSYKEYLPELRKKYYKTELWQMVRSELSRRLSRSRR